MYVHEESGQGKCPNMMETAHFILGHPLEEKYRKIITLPGWRILRRGWPRAS